MNAFTRATVLVSVVVAMLSVPACLHFRTDMTIAQQRVSAGSVQVNTPCGTIEYATVGSGIPLLLIHGAGGGFDQGLAFGQPLADRGLQIVAPSRFGYLRTPVPQDASAEAQADAHACLLDHLGIASIAVLGASAGAPSAMQFCIRHPQRCSALVLVVPATYSPANANQTMTIPPSLEMVFDHVLGSNEILWFVTRVNPGLLVRTMLATPRPVFDAADATERRRAIGILDAVQPARSRTDGLRIDSRITSKLPRYPLERITAPTLLISLEDDLFGTFENASYTASQIPGSKLVTFPSGGHIWLGHDEEVNEAIAEFVTVM